MIFVNLHMIGGVILEDLYTCDEVATRYSVKPSTVWSWIRNKKLPAIRTGNGYRIRESDLKAFEEERMTVK